MNRSLYDNYYSHNKNNSINSHKILNKKPIVPKIGINLVGLKKQKSFLNINRSFNQPKKKKKVDIIGQNIKTNRTKSIDSKDITNKTINSLNMSQWKLNLSEKDKNRSIYDLFESNHIINKK